MNREGTARKGVGSKRHGLLCFLRSRLLTPWPVFTNRPFFSRTTSWFPDGEILSRTHMHTHTHTSFLYPSNSRWKTINTITKRGLGRRVALSGAERSSREWKWGGEGGAEKRIEERLGSGEWRRIFGNSRDIIGSVSRFASCGTLLGSILVWDGEEGGGSAVFIPGSPWNRFFESSLEGGWKIGATTPRVVTVPIGSTAN